MKKKHTQKNEKRNAWKKKEGGKGQKPTVSSWKGHSPASQPWLRNQERYIVTMINLAEINCVVNEWMEVVAVLLRLDRDAERRGRKKKQETRAG